MATPKAGYYLPDGSRIPGTTTIIGRYKDSGGLLWWAFEQGKAAQRGEIASLYDKRDEAANTGTLAHSMIEKHVNGDDPDIALQGVDEESCKQARNAFEMYLKWERQTNIKLLSKYQEIQLVSREYRFGGTPDAIGEIDGEIVLLDWKTSNGLYPDYLIQLAAYRHLVEDGVRMDTHESMDMRITGGFHLCRFAKDYPDFGHHYFGELDEAWEQFKDFRRCYGRDKMLKKRAA